MPTATYTPLATVTLGSSASSVSFASIPASYRDLILVCDYTGSTTAVVTLRYNSDSGANYSTVVMTGTSTGVSSFTGSSLNVGAMYGSNKNTTVFQVMDYSATDKHKTSLQRNDNAQQSEVVATAGRWANTAAITSISLTPTSGTLSTGATFNLFGIVA